MYQKSIYETFNSFSDYDEIIEEICNGYFSLDFDEHNTRFLIHLYIRDEDLQTMFLKEEIYYLEKLDRKIRWLIK